MSHDHNNTRILPAHAWWGVNRKADPCRFSPSLLHKHLLSWGKGPHVVRLLQLLLCMPNPHWPPRSSQTAASLLFHSLQLQYVHKPQFIQHRVGPGMSASTRHNRNNVCSYTKSKVFIQLLGGLRPWQKVQCWSERGPSWFPLPRRLANVQWSVWVNSAGRKKSLIDDRKLFWPNVFELPQNVPLNVLSFCSQNTNDSG